MNELALVESPATATSISPVEGSPPKDCVQASAGVYSLTEYARLPDESGIYCIFNVQTCKPYVGSGGGKTSSIRTRLGQHLGMLRSGKHYNVKLRGSAARRGVDSFACFALELCANDKNTLQAREDFWIERLNAVKGGYNIAPKAWTLAGIEWSAETNEKRKASNLTAWLNPELRNRLSAKFKGVHRGAWSDSSRETVSRKMKEQWASGVRKCSFRDRDVREKAIIGIRKSLQDPRVRAARIAQIMSARPKWDDERRKRYARRQFHPVCVDGVRILTPEELVKWIHTMRVSGVSIKRIADIARVDGTRIYSAIRLFGGGYTWPKPKVGAPFKNKNGAGNHTRAVFKRSVVTEPKR